MHPCPHGLLFPPSCVQCRAGTSVLKTKPKWLKATFDKKERSTKVATEEGICFICEGKYQPYALIQLWERGAGSLEGEARYAHVKCGEPNS